MFDAGTLTVGQYVDKWLLSVKDTVRQRTRDRYESILRIHVKPALGSVKLKVLTSTHVKNLYRTIGSPRHAHITLHKVLNDAVSDNLISRNVADGLKPSKPHKKEINPLTPDQAKAFLAAAHSDRFYALYVLAIHYGLRQGELLGLKWGDIDLENRTLQVRRTTSESRVGRIGEKPKNGKGRRIELSEKALAEARVAPSDLLRRHMRGDWGEVPQEDARENGLSLKHGFRVLSSYPLRTGQRIWILTEADRSSTCILLPSDY